MSVTTNIDRVDFQDNNQDRACPVNPYIYRDHYRPRKSSLTTVGGLSGIDPNPSGNFNGMFNYDGMNAAEFKDFKRIPKYYEADDVVIVNPPWKAYDAERTYMNRINDYNKSKLPDDYKMKPVSGSHFEQPFKKPFLKRDVTLPSPIKEDKNDHSVFEGFNNCKPMSNSNKMLLMTGIIMLVICTVMFNSSLFLGISRGFSLKLIMVLVLSILFIGSGSLMIHYGFK